MDGAKEDLIDMFIVHSTEEIQVCSSHDQALYWLCILLFYVIKLIMSCIRYRIGPRTYFCNPPPSP